MGYAYGELFNTQLAKQYKNAELMYPTIAHDLLEDFGVPASVLDLLTPDIFLRIAYLMLDINWQVALQYIPQRFQDEIQGIADGAGIDVTEVRRANILPELTQAHCTVLGAWGVATTDNRLLHLRALDWDAYAPINQFPTVIIYKPTESGSKPFANIGYMGSIGTLTAMSKIGISAGEKVMVINDPKYYPEDPQITYFGKPWMFVLRDTVQFANNIADVEDMLLSAQRTMKIHGGWGSLPDNTFRGMNYAANYVEFFDDKNYTWYNNFSQPQLDGVFFLNKHVQPSDDPCMGNILREQHGQITAETMYRDIVGYQRTGDNKWAVMDPEAQEIWVAYSQYGTTINAFERSPIHIRLNDYWTDTLSPSFLL